MNKLTRQQYNLMISLMIITLVTIVFLTVFLYVVDAMAVPHAWAEESISLRDEINEMKAERVKQQQRLNEIPLLIEENEKRQSALSVLRDRYQQDLEELKDLKDDSFQSIKNIEDKEKQIQEVKDDINKLKDDKIIFLNEISTVKEKINELNKTLKLSIPKPSNIQAIGIVLSKACIIENTHVVSNPNISLCPNYEKLIQLDNSNYDVTGSFENVDGMFDRSDDGNYLNSWRWYDLNEYLIFVDPPANYYPNLKMIYIEQDLTGFTDLFQLAKKDHTRTLSNDRFVDRSCKESVINAEQWQRLLADTIYYMRHNCNPEYTLVDTVETIVDSFVEHDITTSQKWKYEAFQQQVKDECLLSYGKCNIVNPWNG